VIPPRERAPDIEITPEAERLIMKALAKDPRQRHQSMEDLYDELQQCYGSVRYRRSAEARPAPIPLQKVKLRTPPDGAPVPTPEPAAQPILLTRRKDRKRTLPLELQVEEGATQSVATEEGAAKTDAADSPAEVWPEDIIEDEDWTDRDIDGAGGSGGG
jgi:serine/threonine protein kinase